MNFNNIYSIYRIKNPNDKERHEILEYILKTQNREEDLNNIIDCMKPPMDITNICPLSSGKNVKVAVIGIGEAGLAAAFELRKIKCDITLFEAGMRFGGRVYTHYFDVNKKYFGEFGPMSIPISHETTWHYINLFKLNTAPFITNGQNNLFYIRNKSAVNDSKGRSVKKNIYPQFNLSDSEKRKSWINLRNSIFSNYFNSLSCDIRKELIQIKSEYSEKIQEIDKLTLKKACECAGMSDEIISMIGFLDGVSEFMDLSFIEMLQRYYTADYEYDYYIPEGMINLPYSLYKALSGNNNEAYDGIPCEDLGNVSMKFNTPVNGIYESQSKDKINIQYTDLLQNEISEEFDFVICTVPFSSLRRIDIKPLITSKKIQAINDMNYETAQKSYLYLKDRFWEKEKTIKRILGGYSFTDLPILRVCYPCDHTESVFNKCERLTCEHKKIFDEPGSLLASYSFGQNALRIGNEDAELQVKDIIRYLSQIHDVPQECIFENLIQYKSLNWSNVQYIWGAGSMCRPGEKTQFSYMVNTPEMNNKLFFAGEHISQKHMSQQGALQSGMIAANKVAEIIKDNIH